MRYFWDLTEIPLKRVLLIESGSRELIENLIPALRQSMGDIPMDLITCFAGLPRGLAEDAVVYRVTDYTTPEKRATLFTKLAARRYSCAGMLCSNESIMTKWKWMLAWKTPAKFFIVNENGDYFWFDRSNIETIRHFALFRAGLTGAGAIRTFGRLLAFPFSVLYLVVYALAAHGRRKIWLATHKGI